MSCRLFCGVQPSSAWARADEAHVTPQDVDQLWQLVERAAPEHAPYVGQTRIVGDLEEAFCLVSVEQLPFSLIRTVVHRAELEDADRAPVAADPRLDEKKK